MTQQTARRQFTTDEYHRMAAAGILNDDDRVELLDGEVVSMSPIGSRHAACVDRLNALLMRRLSAKAIVRVQSPIALGRYSEPQPDISVLKLRSDYYVARHPTPADVLLVIEVIDRSHRYDRELKLPVYARAGIREAWLIDLEGARLEVYRRPALRGYPEPRLLERGEHVAPLAFPRTRLRVAHVLG